MKNVEKLVFEKLLLSFWNLIPQIRVKEQQLGLSIRQQQDLADSLVAAVTAWFLSGHKQDVRTERDTIEFPATPWDFFKEKYMPKWFIRRWPVKMKTREFRVSVHHHYVCPHIEVPPESRGINIHYAWMGEMSGQLPTKEGL